MGHISAADIKLDTYNECPGAVEAARIINDWHVGDWATVTDCDHQYWQNNDDTLVLKIEDKNNSGLMAGLNFAKAIRALGPDEYDTMQVSAGTFIRMWWD
jgi:hypothetical protein